MSMSPLVGKNIHNLSWSPSQGPPSTTCRFRHPEPGNDGFSWSEVDPEWQNWTPAAYKRGLEHSRSKEGFWLDFSAMHRADFGILVLPAGRSAHIEAGYFIGAGKPLFILLEQVGKITPELMYLMANAICSNLYELEAALPPVDGVESRPPQTRSQRPARGTV